MTIIVKSGTLQERDIILGPGLEAINTPYGIVIQLDKGILKQLSNLGVSLGKPIQEISQQYSVKFTMSQDRIGYIVGSDTTPGLVVNIIGERTISIRSKTSNFQFTNSLRNVVLDVSRTINGTPVPQSFNNPKEILSMEITPMEHRFTVIKGFATESPNTLTITVKF